MSSAPRRLLVSATILLLPAVILAGAWRLGGVSALEDDLIYYLPIRQYIAERIRAGEFPLWNPLVAMGTPVAADPQSGLWYPATYLFVLLPPLAAYPVSLVLHFALAGAGMYRFLRASRRDWRAAMLGAVAFEFCGYLVGHRAHLTIHHAAAWAPWMLYGWRRFADRGQGRFAVLAAAAFGLQLLVQHVQVSIITAVLVTGYVGAVLARWRPGGRASRPPCLGEDGEQPKGGRDARPPTHRRDVGAARLWWVYPAGMAAGAMLAGIQLLPTWLHYAGSVRGAPSFYLFNENYWLPTSAPLLLFPMLLGARTPNLWSEPWWGPSHFCEQSAYASVLVLVLAAASLRLVRTSSSADGDEPIGEQFVRARRFLWDAAPRVWPRLRPGLLVEVLSEEVRLARTGFRRKLRWSVWQEVRAAWRGLPYGWNREAAFWWAACLAALLIALGDLTPLGRLLFHVPLYRSLRVPARWILVWSVAMPVLAAMVVSTLLRDAHQGRRMAAAVRFAVLRVLPAGAVACLLLLAVAARRADSIAAAFPGLRIWPKIAGLMLASRLDNAAIWWPLLVMAATGWALLRWLRSAGFDSARGGGEAPAPQAGAARAFALVFVIFLVDIAAVAGFVDVDMKTYTRRDLLEPPPLARAIRKLDPRPGDRLLVPRCDSSYERPIEVLWPQSNIRYGIATFNGYGPLESMGGRMLLRFAPWGSSEEMLALLRNGPLLRALGVRFIAVRSPEERELLRMAQLSAAPPEPEELPPGADRVRPARYGQDLLWGPVSIRAPGLYELSFDVVPVKGSPSRWFVRMETPEKDEIDRTRTIDPADMTAGPRRMRFLYHFAQPTPAVMVRVKSEMGEALSAGRASIRPVAVESSPPAPQTSAGGTQLFTHRADLPGLPAPVSLYEAPGTRPLVYWARSVEVTPDLVAAVDRLHARAVGGEEDEDGDEDWTVVESTGFGEPVPAVQEGRVRVERRAGHELRVAAGSVAGGLLVFNESHDPGWRAAIDGEPATVLRVNAVCQGVRVPPGEHEVRFSYSPPGLKPGAAVSAAGVVLLVGSLVLASHRTGPRGPTRWFPRVT